MMDTKSAGLDYDPDSDSIYGPNGEDLSQSTYSQYVGDNVGHSNDLEEDVEEDGDEDDDDEEDDEGELPNFTKT